MKIKNLNNINSSFKTPKNYFSNLEDSIINDIHLESKIPESGFKVPEHYFENLNTEIAQKLSTDKEKLKVFKLITKPNLIWLTGIAASILILLMITFKTNNTISFNTLNDDLLSEYIIEQSSENELISLFDNEELTQLNFLDYTLNEDYLDTILEDEDIEHLITD